jgi:hypothetical protein
MLTALHDSQTKRHASGAAMHDQWVVTYRMEARNPLPEGWICGVEEFYRGSREECVRISRAFAGGESDLVPTNPWSVAIGPAADWEDFLSSNS